MKTIRYLFYIINILFFTNTYSQVSIWKFDGSTSATGAIPANVGRTVSVFGGTGAASSGNTWWGPVQYIYVGANNWQVGSMAKGFKLQVRTRLFDNLKISYSHGSDDYNGTNIGPQDFKLQYSLDDISYTDIPGGTESIVGGVYFENCFNRVNFALPADCNNRDEIYLRWIMTSNTGTKGKAITASGYSYIANVNITGIEIPVAPSNITLSNSSIASGLASGTTVGNLTQTDENTSGTYTFSLVAGTGSTNNNLFSISGNQLKTAAILGPGEYHIRINVSDGTFNYAKEFVITVVSQPPTDITLSSDSLAHNPSIGTIVGTLSAIDADAGDTHTFTLVAGDGDTDNTKFSIVGDELRVNAILIDNIYSVRINANDGINDYAKTFLVGIGYGIFNFIFPDVSYIKNVTFNTINNNSSYGSSGYENFSSLTTTLDKSSTYTISFTLAPNDLMDWGVSRDLKVKAYFDWNHNLSFIDDGEGYILADSVKTLTASGNITVPADALTGNTRFRIVYWYDEYTANNYPPSTGTANYGEAEDYTAVVNEPLPVELVSFTANKENNTVKIKWQTATEVNNYGFEVERSLSSEQGQVSNHWEKIGFVEGNGNCNSPKQYSFIDSNSTAGSLQYRLKQIDTDGNFRYYSNIIEVNLNITGLNEKQSLKDYILEQNYPNPFNPTTIISYQLPMDGNVMLKVYDLPGNEVITLVDEFKSSGYYTVEFNAGNLSSGVYFYKLMSGNFTSIKKLILIK